MHALAQQMETHKSVTGELVENIQASAVHKASSDVKGIVVNASHVIDEGINTCSDGHEEEEESDVNIIEIIDNEKQDLDESVMNAVNTNIIELLKQAVEVQVQYENHLKFFDGEQKAENIEVTHEINPTGRKLLSVKEVPDCSGQVGISIDSKGQECTSANSPEDTSENSLNEQLFKVESPDENAGDKYSTNENLLEQEENLGISVEKAHSFSLEQSEQEQTSQKIAKPQNTENEQKNLEADLRKIERFVNQGSTNDVRSVEERVGKEKLVKNKEPLEEDNTSGENSDESEIYEDEKDKDETGEEESDENESDENESDEEESDEDESDEEESDESESDEDEFDLSEDPEDEVETVYKDLIDLEEYLNSERNMITKLGKLDKFLSQAQFKKFFETEEVFEPIIISKDQKNYLEEFLVVSFDFLGGVEKKMVEIEPQDQRIFSSVLEKFSIIELSLFPMVYHLKQFAHEAFSSFQLITRDASTDPSRQEAVRLVNTFVLSYHYAHELSKIILSRDEPAQLALTELSRAEVEALRPFNDTIVANLKIHKRTDEQAPFVDDFDDLVYLATPMDEDDNGANEDYANDECANGDCFHLRKLLSVEDETCSGQNTDEENSRKCNKNVNQESMNGKQPIEQEPIKSEKWVALEYPKAKNPGKVEENQELLFFKDLSDLDKFLASDRSVITKLVKLDKFMNQEHFSRFVKKQDNLESITISINQRNYLAKFLNISFSFLGDVRKTIGDIDSKDQTIVHSVFENYYFIEFSLFPMVYHFKQFVNNAFALFQQISHESSSQLSKRENAKLVNRFLVSYHYAEELKKIILKTDDLAQLALIEQHIAEVNALKPFCETIFANWKLIRPDVEPTPLVDDHDLVHLVSPLDDDDYDGLISDDYDTIADCASDFDYNSPVSDDTGTRENCANRDGFHLRKLLSVQEETCSKDDPECPEATDELKAASTKLTQSIMSTSKKASAESLDPDDAPFKTRQLNHESKVPTVQKAKKTGKLPITQE